MSISEQIQAELDRGFTKADLEFLIGLPQNTLSGVLAGKREFSKKSEIKVAKFLASEKPDPFLFSRPKTKKQESASYGLLIPENVTVSYKNQKVPLLPLPEDLLSKKDLNTKKETLILTTDKMHEDQIKYPGRFKNETGVDYKYRMELKHGKA